MMEFEAEESNHVPAGSNRRLAICLCVIQAVVFIALLAAAFVAVPRVGKIFKDFEAELPENSIRAIEAAEALRGNVLQLLGVWIGVGIATFVCCNLGKRRQAIVITAICTAGIIAALVICTLALSTPYHRLLEKIK